MKQVFAILSFLLAGQATFSQTVIKNIMHDGIEREYRLYVPDIYDGSEGVPLVLNLHGYTSNAFEQEVYGDFRPIADTANFILVHPEGTLDGTGTTFWNAFGSPTETVDDIGFLSALIDSLAMDYNINMNRVYSTGMSNGGFMSYRLACELSYRITAIASVTGAMIDPNFLTCNPSHPTPVMQIHGTADPTVPYLGNTGVLGAEAGAAYWANFNNCNPTASQMSVPDIDLTDGCTADHFVYSGGDAGSSVELYRVNGGGHTWPGSNPFITIGVTNQDFSASVEIWRFFSQYRLNELVGVQENQLEKQFSVFPNPSNGVLNIQFEKEEERTIRVQNSLGQIVQEFDSDARIVNLNLNESGVYILTIITQDGLFSEKLVRE